MADKVNAPITFRHAQQIEDVLDAQTELTVIEPANLDLVVASTQRIVQKFRGDDNTVRWVAQEMSLNSNSDVIAVKITYDGPNKPSWVPDALDTENP